MSGNIRPCPVVGCSERVKPAMLMCRAHWHQVSDKTRRMVNSAWRHFMRTARSERRARVGFLTYPLEGDIGHARRTYDAARDLALAEASRFEP